MTIISPSDQAQNTYESAPTNARRVVNVDSLGNVTGDLFDTLIDEVSGTTTYVGEAAAGSSESSAVWRIQKIDSSSNPTSVTWANGSTAFDKVWNDRTTYTY